MPRFTPSRQLVVLTILSISLGGSMLAGQDQADQEETAPDTTEKDDEKWDITEPTGPTTEIAFETSEGTWISLDVSPDGRHIVFDLLGDIYLLPIDGGQATRLTSGPAWDVQPAYSPDGKSIAYTSDRDGAENIWIMDADGSDPRKVTSEKDRILNNPVFTPDGQYVIARKHYRNTRSLGAGEMWMYHISGGDGLAVSERRDWQHDAGEPDISPDGGTLYYSQDISPGSTYQYNRNPYGSIYAIEKIDLDTGKKERAVGGLGGAMTPEVSPDGKSLAFIRRVQLKTALFVKDLASGDERKLYDGLNRDSQETWSHFGTNPGYSWTPDGSHIIISAKGKIMRVALASGRAAEIPFTAQVEQTLTEPVSFKVPVGGATFPVKTVKYAAVSPNGRQIVFQALGRLYKANADGTGRKLFTNGRDRFEFTPSWSPDGRSVVFTTWQDATGGGIEVASASSGKTRRLKLPPGHYLEPAWSPDGERLIYRKLGGNRTRGFNGTAEPGIYIIPAKGGTPQLVTTSGSQPRFSPDGERILLRSREDDEWAIISIDLNGQDRRIVATDKNAQALVPSPDGQWIAFTERFNLYVAPLARSGKALELSPKMKNMPVAHAGIDGQVNVHWSGDSKTVYWTMGAELYSRSLKELFDFAAGAADKLPGPDSSGVALGWDEKTNLPKGSLAFTGATLLTMDDAGVIENGVVVVTDGRISAVGPAGSTSIPRGARTIDVSGKFIMPGLIDVHAHVGGAGDGITAQQNWAYLANLAFGVTTTHDPSNNTVYVFAASELQKAGKILAPRLFSTGRILYGAEFLDKAVINSVEDARSHMRRLKAYGAFSVKSYNQPRRDQRQQILAAARELQMMVYPEGGSTLQWNLNMILDGHTGIEHSIPVSPLYNDVISLYAASKVGYTPTLVVSYGGLWGENYWYQHQNVFEHKRLLAFTPRELLDNRGRRRMHVEDDDYNYLENAKAVAALAKAGVAVNLGAHGQLDGLAAHWEIWMLVQGGMPPMEALRAATLNGAVYIGMGDDLGSITQGKLADLLVLSANPLDDIRNSEMIDQVMLGGRLYDGMTLDEVWPKAAQRPPLYWQRR